MEERLLQSTYATITKPKTAPQHAILTPSLVSTARALLIFGKAPENGAERRRQRQPLPMDNGRERNNMSHVEIHHQEEYSWGPLSTPHHWTLSSLIII